MAESAVPQALAGLQISKTKELKGTEKRDSLIAQERRFQQAWEQEKVFEANAPTTTEIPLHSISAAELRNKTPKWTGTIAYPYMNGVLHVGHGFSFSKVEFTAGFARMRGKRVLWPQGFHCTGLPIKACADKLVEEVKMFGQEFERYKEEEPVAEAVVQATAPAAKGAKEDVTKFSSHKGKAGAKTIKAKYQFQIMKSMGIPVQEIHRFADASYWLEFFPPLCKTHLTNLGCRIDWRRSMVTTDANPYYDAFVRWQMTRLKELGKIRYGKRYTIYSAKDGQPCMDHDRSEGEALGPQEYTALKLKVVEYAPGFAKAIEGKIPEGASVYLVPATLRPETMYGQTCCFVGPKLDYGVFKGKKDNEYFLMTPRAAKNLAFQSGLSDAEDMKIPEQLAAVVGADMIGTLVNAPLSVHKQVRVLPMDTVLATKGTGVVTCVASDSPDDYATVADLRKKADYYKIKAEWAELEIVPIIDTPAYGNLTAEFLVKKLKISSPKDVKPLAEAKEAAYKEGFYNGTMLVGSCKGKKVQEAKDIIKKELFDSGDAFAYAEPEGRVVSRSGDECIVALLNQWFLTYGEEEWKQQALEFVENKDGKGLNTYIPETQNAFVGVLNWLYQWACGRTYGLGTRMPFDENVLVESLSDSTIYMSYYTIAHFLHSDNFGKQKGTGNIEPEQMTNEIWDYVFCRRELDDEIIKASRISRETLESMRREFEYFYPLDLRASGKDLIPNHLTFFIYNHIALFPREYWPVSIRTNGHLMLNGEKMSKSTGNFMTLNESISKFGSDATRMAFADAGDGIGDANFDEDVADATILNLFTKREVMAELAKDQDQLRTGELNSYPDKLFRNEMHTLVREAERHYEDTNYKLAIQSAWFLFGSIFSFYKEACAATGIKLHKDLIMEYIELHALIMTPITPHWSEYIWLDILKKSQSIQHALWPQVPEADPGLTAAYNYAKGTSSNINSAEGQFLRKLGKGKATSFDPKKPKKLTVFVASKFPSWQEKYIDVLKRHWDASASSVRDEKALMAEVGAFKELKKAAPFVNQLKKRLQGGEDAGTVLERKLAFDESALLLDMVPSLKRVAGFHTVTIVSVEEGSKAGKDLTDGGKEVEVTSQTAENAVPGIPTFNFENVEA